MTQPMLIAPYKTGLDTDLEPWMAPADSFSSINNIHVHHGYLEKRSGYRLFGNLIPDGVTVVINNVTQANPGVITTAAPHLASTGDKLFITAVTGMTEINDKIFTIIVLTPTTFSIDLDTTTLTAYAGAGTMAITSTITDRVMGITRYIQPAGTKTTLAFNTVRAFSYNTASDLFVQLDVANIMAGGENDYIWSANWQSGGGTNRFYFTNGLEEVTPLAANPVNGIRYFEQAAPAITTPFNPILGTGPPQRNLVGALLIFSLGQRLVVLNTHEYNAVSTSNFPQRARWSARQDPSNWDDVTAGGGGFTDAATGDQIISARVLQNQIIVFFTNSIWTLIPTSNPSTGAFRWKKLNSFRACDAKMGSVAYANHVLAVGERGVTSTDGIKTLRIDDRIEEFTTDTINVGQFQKVFCERSYAHKRWWTLFSGVISDENDSALIYDDGSKSYNTYSININCLGYGNLSRNFTLADFTIANGFINQDGQEMTLQDYGDNTLQSYFWQDNSEIFLGGDLNGSIYGMESDGDDYGTAIESELFTASWNPFKEEGRECQLNFIDIFLDTDTSTKATVEFYKDTDIYPYASQEIDFLPDLGFISTIIDASQTNPVNINAPNHGLSTGSIIYIYGVEGMSINSGETAPSYTITNVDEDNFTLDGIDGTILNPYTGGGAAYLRRFYRSKSWKRAYGGGIGFQHRIKFTSNASDQPFRIHAMKPSFKAVGGRTIN